MKRGNAILAIFTLLTSTAIFAQQLETERLALRPFAQEGSISSGAKAGFADIKDLGDPVFTLGAYGEAAIIDNLLLGLSLDYWSKSTGALTRENIDLDAITLAGTGKYVFSSDRLAVYPYALVGLALHRFAKAESESTDAGIKKTHTNVGRFGLDYGAGVLYPVQEQLDVNAEVRMRSILSSTEKYDHVTLAGGLAYKM